MVENLKTENLKSETLILDVDEKDFESEVIQASDDLPIVVDFWAPWCGPCRMLGPVLEKLALEGAGSWRLVKVNVDHNQAVAQRFGVRGIPAVQAFRNGEVVDAFVGAQPEPEVRSFLAGLSAGDDPEGARNADAVPSAPSNGELIERLEAAMAVLESDEATDVEREASSGELIETFALIGNDHEVTRRYRSRMANVIW